MKIKSCIIYLMATVLVSLFCLSGCFMLPTMPWQREEMYSYYSDDSNYIEVYGTITANFFDYDGTGWVLLFDDEFVSANQELCKNFSSNNPHGAGFQITNKTYEILFENGFYDLVLDESEIDESVEYPAIIEETVYIVTSIRTWWGMGCPVIQVRVGDTVYLDYETGKANFLSWIQNEMY